MTSIVNNSHDRCIDKQSVGIIGIVFYSLNIKVLHYSTENNVRFCIVMDNSHKLL